MKKFLFFLISLSFLVSIFGQNGKILERHRINFFTNPEIKDKLLKPDSKKPQFKEKYQYLNSVIVEKITYESDGYKVKGYLAYPKKMGKYPAIIYNRGGNLEFGKLNIKKAAFIFGRVASWGYVIVGSQYRGNDGGVGGRDEFGGAEVDDVLNLIPLLKNFPQANTFKLGIYGWSRGGMETYITLTKCNKFKAAVVGGGLSDLYMMMKSRPDMEEVYVDLIPNYKKNKKKALDLRSAIKFVDKIPKNVPILMLHGTADWRVVPQMSLNLAGAFLKYKIPFRLVMFEGGDHGLDEFTDEVDRMVKNWFDKYLKFGHPLPDLNPHGP